MMLLGGPVASHMALHVVLMNGVAPILALAAAGRLSRFLPSPASPLLAAAVVVQLLLLWGWHAPGVLERSLALPSLHLAMQLSLFAAALWFWSAVFAARGGQTWRSLFALLVTGKLFCLLGALLVFAPRPLYAALGAGMPGLGLELGHAHGHGMPADLLADQQLAGLLMLVACPLAYVTAGTVLAARWLHALEVGVEPARR